MNVMKRAWEIAKEGVVKFGGTVKEYFAASLKLAWEEVKRIQNIKDVKVEVESNDWKNYGKHRLYITVKMSLVELKEIKGNMIGALRRMSRKMYYNWEDGKIYGEQFIGKDISSAADEVVEFMKSEIIKLAWAEVKKAI